MQFRDLKAQYQALKEDIDSAMLSVAKKANFISGEEVEKLEKELCEYVGSKYCVTCGNGTDALTMAVMAWGIKEGDAVFVPDFTFFASAEIVAFEGATPIFVDVKKDTFNIDCDKLEIAIKKVIKEGKYTPKAIVPVDLFGLSANYVEVREIANKYNLKILEDGAQGFGGRIGDKVACSFGDISTTSFFPAKPLGCYGDGGAIFTDDKETYEYLKSIRVHGKGSYKYDNVRIGLNSRLDTIQAAVLSVKLKAFKDYELEKVNWASKVYTKNLANVVKTPIIPDGYYSSWAQYTITLESKEMRDGLQAFLKENEIPSMIYYPIPMHKQTAFANEVYDESDFTVTNYLCDRVLSLPMHPYLKEEEILLVCEKVIEYIKK